MEDGDLALMAAASVNEGGTAPLALDLAAPLTRRQLEDHLRASDDLFRGLTDVEVQRDYVLALLFFRRASDVYEEAAVEAEEPELRIPDGATWWEAIRTDPDRLGAALNEALRRIAEANPRQLAGVFDYIDFTNRKALPPENLAQVVRHFDALGPLTRARIPPDMLGRVYEWLLARFGAMAGKVGGEFYTPEPVGVLGARILAPPPEATVYDPTCGSGGLLLHLRQEAFRLHGDRARALKLYGQEIKPTTWSIARMNMVLHGAAEAATIEQGDTLLAPAFLDGGKLQKFDLIIANPPFSSRNWGHERFKTGGDPFGRIVHLPPKRHGEMAFVQHMVASLKDTGRMAVILPNGALFREGTEQLVRRDLLEADLVEAVIQLPEDMFFGTGIPANYLIVNKAKPEGRRGRVLFIDASECYERRETKNVLQDIDRIAGAFQSDDNEEGFSSWVDLDKIRSHQYSLTVRRYVRKPRPSTVTLAEALAGLHASRERCRAAEAALDAVIAELQEAG